MPIIEVEGVTKEFWLGQQRSLRQSLAALGERLRGRAVAARAPFKALDDVSFTVEAGEVLGVIGHNGAGKSTLLKLLAGISSPTRGRVAVRGRVAPLIEVGAGLVPDLTGRENIFVNGAILGMKRAEIRRKFDEIVGFAELEEFLDTPVKRYSSGMQVRLGFSIATSVAADILIVDEVLAVGDLAFQRKCFDRMEDMIKRQGRTVLLVSHNIRQVERLCARALLLDHGRVTLDASSRETCGRFFAQMQTTAGKRRPATQEASGEIELLELQLLDGQGNMTDCVTHQKGVIVSALLRVKSRLDHVTIGLGVHTADFVYLTTHNTEQQIPRLDWEPGIYRVRFAVPSFSLLPGAYALRLGVTAGAVGRAVYYAENILQFEVESEATLSGSLREGLFRLDGAWSVDTVQQGGVVGKDEVAGPPTVQI